MGLFDAISEFIGDIINTIFGALAQFLGFFGITL
jgi:hypothetical protein